MARGQSGGKGIDNIALVELGTGCCHGNNSTKAAVRACNNAIEWASVKVRNIIPGAYDELKLHVQLGVPNPADVDLEQVAACFPHGELQPVLIEQGGLLGSSRGGFVAEETVDGLMTIACACVTIGWNEPVVKPSVMPLDSAEQDGGQEAGFAIPEQQLEPQYVDKPTDRWYETVQRSRLEKSGAVAAARLTALSQRGQEQAEREVQAEGEAPAEEDALPTDARDAAVLAAVAKQVAAAQQKGSELSEPGESPEPPGPLRERPSKAEMQEGTPEMRARAQASKEKWSTGDDDKRRVLTPYEAFGFIGEEEEVEIIDVRTPTQRMAHVINGKRALSVKGALCVPLDDLVSGAAPLPPAGLPLVLICKWGVKSLVALDYLAERCPKAVCVEGGISAWDSASLPVEQIDDTAHLQVGD